MPADGMEKGILSADAAMKAALESDEQSSLSDFAQALAWSRDNIATPALNAGVVEPTAVVAQTINAVSKQSLGRDIVAEPQRWQLPAAEFMSPAWFAQNVSAGLAMVIPYTLAGRSTAGALGLAGKSLEVEGAFARVIASEKTAMILGAGLYDGLKKPEADQTRLGNALGGMAAFSAYEFGNPLLAKSAPLGKTAGLMAVGAAGSFAHLTTSELVSQGRLPNTEQLTAAGLSGSVMNVLLPYAQSVAMRPFTAEAGTGRSDEHLVVIRAYSTEAPRAPMQADNTRALPSESASPAPAGKIASTDSGGIFKWDSVPILGAVVSRARKISNGLHEYLNETIEAIPQTLEDMSSNYGGNSRELTPAEHKEKVIKQLIRSNVMHFGKDSFYSAHSLTMLADLYASQNRIYEASKNYEQVAALMQKHLPPGDSQLGDFYSKLGHYYSRTAKEPLAEKYLEMSLENKAAQFGQGAMELTGDLGKLAEVSVVLGKPDQAEAAYLRLTQIMEGHLKPLDPALTDTLAKVSTFFRSIGKESEAKTLHDQVMLNWAADITKAALGDEHKQFGRDLEALQAFLRRQGKTAMSQSLENDIKIVDLANKIKEPEYPGLERDLRLLAQAYRKRNDPGDLTVAFRTEARAEGIAQRRRERR